MKRLMLLSFPLAMACAAQIPDHVELQPGAQDVEIVHDKPSPNAYKEVGQVTGIASGTDDEVAEAAAENDLRNKAAALGATLVTVEQNLGKAVLLSDKKEIKLVGRAYKPVD
jgi:hypothetical protein